MTSDLNIDFLYFSLIIIIYAQAVNKSSSGRIIKNSQTLEKLAFGIDCDQKNTKNNLKMRRGCSYLNCDSTGNVSGKYENHYTLNNCPLYHKVKR